ncbi:hypothetical protein OAF54_00155 [bacterium]|nr:hypothetical protein [bacterium]
MSRYTFQCEHYSLLDAERKTPTCTITMEHEKESLPEILEEMEHFLLACGFKFDGTLDIVDEE